MAGFYDSVTEIQAFPSVYLHSNSYVITNSGHAIVIDPCRTEALFCAIEGIVVDFCLLTHEHYDHINGVNELKRRFDCQVLCSKICAERIQNPRHNAAWYFPAFNRMQRMEIQTDAALIDQLYCCTANLLFEREQGFQWRGHSFFLRETPGHSPGSICILMDRRILFSGDTLTAGTKPCTRFPGGDQTAFCRHTVPFLCSLLPGTVVYPGHYGSFLLKDANFI